MGSGLVGKRRIPVALPIVILAAILILAGLAGPRVTEANPQVSVGSGAGFWHTNGRQIVDANEQPVRMTINWFGWRPNAFCPHGLWAQLRYARPDQEPDKQRCACPSAQALDPGNIPAAST
jgi:hypothetical protein